MPMPEHSDFLTPLAAAQFLVREGRLPELRFDSLDQDGREQVGRQLKERLWRTRRRTLIAHLTGAGLTAVFLALIGAVLLIGPGQFVSWFNGWVGWKPATPGGDKLWGIEIIFLAGIGFLSAYYVLRGRMQINRNWDAETASVTQAIARGEQSHPAADPASHASESVEAAEAAAPLRASIDVLRRHANDLPAHYLIERLSEIARGEPVTPESLAAVHTTIMHLRLDCHAPTQADALERWAGHTT